MNKKNMLAVLAIAGQLLHQYPAFSQAVVIPEELKKKCAGTPFENKLKIQVYKFSNSVSGVDGRKIDNFSTMLTNALFQLDCFNVMAEAKDTMGMSKSRDRDAEADIIAYGEIIEYYHKSSTSNAFISSKTTYTAHIGFNLRIVDSKTQSMVFSGSYNKEARSDQKSTTLPISLNSRNGGQPALSHSSDENVDKAYADALEKSVLGAVTDIVSHRDEIQAKVKTLGTAGSDPNVRKETKVIITNTTYQKNKDVESALKGLGGVTIMAPPVLRNGEGIIMVSHTGTTDDLAGVISNHSQAFFEITSVEPGKITIRTK